MNKIIRALMVLILTCSSNAHAFHPYLGLQTNLPGLFGNNGGVGLPLFGVRFGIDFDQPNSGFGMRVSGSNLLLILAIRADVNAYYRIPVDANGGNLYIGAGVALWTPSFVGGGWSDAHGLIGYEASLAPWLTGFVELAPGVVIGGGRFNNVGSPDQAFDSYVGQPAITISSGINFRF